MTDERNGATVFPTERMYWVGVDPAQPEPGETHETDPGEADRAFDAICAAEGLDESILTRLILSEQDARGDIGARYVASFRVSADQSLREFAAQQEGRGQAWAGAGFVPRWRVVFERFREVGEPEPAGSPIVLVAMTPALDATDEQIDDFNEFYNGTHLPEVLHDWDWRRATRYELRHEILHPAPGCPRYLAIYEVRAGSRTVPRSATGEQGYSSGPSAWEARNTAWRLRYTVS